MWSGDLSKVPFWAGSLTLKHPCRLGRRFLGKES